MATSLIKYIVLFLIIFFNFLYSKNLQLIEVDSSFNDIDFSKKYKIKIIGIDSLVKDSVFYYWNIYSLKDSLSKETLNKFLKKITNIYEDIGYLDVKIVYKGMEPFFFILFEKGNPYKVKIIEKRKGSFSIFYIGDYNKKILEYLFYKRLENLKKIGYLNSYISLDSAFKFNDTLYIYTHIENGNSINIDSIFVNPKKYNRSFFKTIILSLGSSYKEINKNCSKVEKTFDIKIEDSIIYINKDKGILNLYIKELRKNSLKTTFYMDSSTFLYNVNIYLNNLYGYPNTLRLYANKFNNFTQKYKIEFSSIVSYNMSISLHLGGDVFIYDTTNIEKNYTMGFSRPIKDENRFKIDISYKNLEKNNVYFNKFYTLQINFYNKIYDSLFYKPRFKISFSIISDKNKNFSNSLTFKYTFPLTYRSFLYRGEYNYLKNFYFNYYDYFAYIISPEVVRGYKSFIIYPEEVLSLKNSIGVIKGRSFFYIFYDYCITRDITDEIGKYKGYGVGFEIVKNSFLLMFLVGYNREVYLYNPLITVSFTYFL